MERDLAIVYQSELYKTKKIISKLNNIGLNTTNYENTVYDIEEACRNNNKEDLGKGLDSPFVVDYLEANYSKAINSLKVMQKELSKYEIYIKVNSFTTLLKSIIKNNKITSKQLDEITPKLISILNELKKSNTLDYSTEKDIVESIYKITYYLLKEEIKHGRKNLYNALITDEIHTIYLDKEISSELEQLERNDSKNTNIFNRKNILDLNGINSHYLDYELLSLLVEPSKQKEDIEDVKDLIPLYQDINTKLHNYRRRLKNISNNIENEKEKMKKQQKSTNYIKSIFSIILSTTITTALFGGAYLGAEVLAKKNSKAKSTTITTYDTRDNSETTTKPFYSTDYTNSIRVTKYEPYRKALAGYYRYVTDYDLGNIANLSNQEIMNLDLDGLGIAKNSHKEFKETISYIDTYDDIYYTISKISVDENNFTYDQNVFWGYFAYLEILAILIYSGINIAPHSHILIGLIKDVKKIKNDIKNSKNYNKENEKCIQERNRIINEVKELLNKYDYELRKLFEYADFICKYGNDEVSACLRETLDSINEELTLIEEKEQGTIVKDTVNKIKKRTR